MEVKVTQVEIVYCRPCGYEKRASAAAAAVKDALGLEASLRPGSGGIFEVKVDGNIVAKRSRAHFPEAEEIVQLVSEAMGQMRHVT